MFQSTLLMLGFCTLQVSSRSDSPTLYDFLDDSTQSSPSISPSQTLKDKYKKRYKKDELWSAIKKNYNYIMDSDIMNTCKVSIINTFKVSDINNTGQ